MKYIWERIGNICHYLTMPLIKRVLNGSARTRVLIVAESYILVTKTWLGDGRWGLPGGGLHKSEDKLDGALREVREEVGIVLDPKQINFSGDLKFDDAGIKMTLSFFKVHLDKAFPVKCQRFEILDARWMELRELNQRNTSPDLFWLIKDFAPNS